MEKVFDAHCHHLFEMPIKEAIEIFAEEFAATGTEKAVFLSIPNDVSPEREFYFDEMQNLRILYLKYSFAPNGYAYAGLEHPLDVAERDEKELSSDYVRQAERYHEVGYDGMKMLEGYPSVRKAMKRRLDDRVYDGYYSFAEENGIPITMHVANPVENWDENKAGEYAKKMGRVYDETFPTKEELTEETFGIMKKHPELKLSLAHFGFLSYDIERAKRWLEDYENTMFDLTPGGEQLLNMLSKWDEWSAFFDKYRDRIIYGTDFYAFYKDEKWEENFMRRPKFLREFFETDTEHVYGKNVFRGINEDKDVLRAIYRDNFTKLLGEPKKIDLEYVAEEAERLLKTPNKRAKYADEDLKYILKNVSGKK